MKVHNKKIILAIETSCDETAAAVLVADLSPKFPALETLSSVVRSQIKLHSKMGGVVPETAARAHLKNILPVVKAALLKVNGQMSNVDYIAVTVGPGLIPSLLVGVEFAKALSLATGKKVVPVNHMEGHLYSPFGREFPISNSPITNYKELFPNVSLIVSGGHTILALMQSEKKYRVLGQTVDDAAGEAFDKVAKLLHLPYPGGPEVSKLAMQGSASIKFPRPMINDKSYNFSFAGLKTAVLYYLKDNNLEPSALNLAPDICASFQEAVVDVLVAKTMRAVREFKAKSISLSGGVAANRALRDALNHQSEILNLKFFVPPYHLCTDNAEMIGIASAFKLKKGFKPVSYRHVKADPNLSL